MPALECFLACESTIIDSITNRVSIINIFESVAPPKLPWILPQVTLIASWRALPGEDPAKEYQVRIAAQPPSAKPNEFRTSFRMTGAGQRIMEVIAGIPIQATGPLTFSLFLNDEPQGTCVIRFTEPSVAPPPPQPA